MSPDHDKNFSIGSLGAVPKIAALLGEFMAAWGLLEHSLRLAFASILKIDVQAAESIMYALRNTSSRIDIIRDLVDRSGHVRRDEILDALAEVQRVAGKRNTYVHSLIGIGPGPRAVRWDFRFNESDPQRRVDVTKEDLSELIMEASDAYNFLGTALHPELGQPPPWRSKYFQQRGAPGTGSKRRRQKNMRKRKRPPQS